MAVRAGPRRRSQPCRIPTPPRRGDGYLAARALLAARRDPLRRPARGHRRRGGRAGRAADRLPGRAQGARRDPQVRRRRRRARTSPTRASCAPPTPRCSAALEPERCTVERMAPLTDGIELLIGARWDPRFGPVALAGSGGLYAEILRDTAVRLAPVTEAEAEAMLRALRIAPLLTGARGRPPLDLGGRGARAGRAVARGRRPPRARRARDQPPAGHAHRGHRPRRALHPGHPVTGARECSSPTPLSSRSCASAPSG